MKLTITQKSEEPLLSRLKVEGEVVFDKATPSKADIAAAVSKSVGKSEKLIDVNMIDTAYGERKASVVCYVYNDEETLDEVKVLGIKAIEKIEKAEKEAEEKAKASAEAKEKPAEEAKAEAKEEAKPEAKEEKKEQPKAEDKK